MVVGVRSTVVASCAVVLVAAGCSGPTDERRDPHEEPAAAAAYDWLPVEQPLQVGATRYISPCQLLTVDDLDGVLEGLNSRHQVDEVALEESVSEGQPPAETSCTHRLGLPDGPVGSVRVSVLQQPEQSPAWKVADVYSSERYLDRAEGRLERWEKLTEDEESATFVAGLRAGHDLVVKQDSTQSALPVDDEGSWRGVWGRDALGVALVSDAAVLSIELAAPTQLGSVTFGDDLDDQETRHVIDRLAQVVPIVEKRLADAELSQAAAPTYPRGITHRGTTALLEPCAVLSSKTFADITGNKATGVRTRQGARIDPEATPSLGETGAVTLPTNVCERSSTHEREGAGVHTSTVRLELWTAADEDELTTSLTAAERFPARQPSREVETAADWSMEWVGVSGARSYPFRVGAYYGDLTFTEVSSESVLAGTSPKPASKKRSLAAVDTLVKELRAVVKQADEVLPTGK